MRKLKLFLSIAVLAIGIGGAFASTSKVSAKGHLIDVEWYAVKTPFGWNWTTTPPENSGYVCTAQSVTAYCIIHVIDGSIPPNNSFPPFGSYYAVGSDAGLYEP